MHDPYIGFDGQAPWATITTERGYDLEIKPGGDGWLPHIEITPRGTNRTYHFVRSFNDLGVYTPGYVFFNGEYPVLDMPGDIPVPKWMPVAIERAGFGYDPVPNSERRDRTRVVTHPDQTELVEG